MTKRTNNDLLGTVLGAVLLLVLSGDAFAQPIVYSFDNLNRLIEVAYPDGTTIRYSYDFSGNRLSETVTTVTVPIPCTFALGQTSAMAVAAAGTGTVAVTATAGCSWTSVSNADFLTVEAGATVAGGGTVAYAVAANNTSAARVGTLTIAGHAFTVTQSAPSVLPTVSTMAVSAITKTTGSTGGIVSADGGDAVTARGVCWSLAAAPTTAGTCTSDGAGTGSFTSGMAGLAPATTYHVRAYAVNDVGTAYGSELLFTTRSLAPTVITVDSFADSFASDGRCTLREAVQAANTDAAVDTCPAGNGGDTIVLPAGAYVLALAGQGEDANAAGDLDIDDDLTIAGAGRLTTTVDGAQLDRIVHIAPSVTVRITGLTIRNGNSYPHRGGGVYSRGSLTMEHVTVTGNTAGGSSGGGVAHDGPSVLAGVTVSANSANNGGGIDATGNLTLQNSMVIDNAAGTGGGGGLAFTGSQLVITESEIGRNVTSGSGGGFYAGGTTTVERSTISGNSATIAGGGILNAGTMSIVSSTVSGNSTGAGGGGVYSNGPLAVVSGTIYANTAAVDGGGILNSNATRLESSIVAGNTANNCAGGGFTSNGYNVSSDDTCALTGVGDLRDTDPLLGALAENGGATRTHALLAGSAAIDAAGTACSSLATDQRGVVRPQGAACDAGAVEREYVNTAPTFTPPASISTPATSVHGAVVTFVAIGNDAEDGEIQAVCAPASGTTFALGTRTVYCAVTDSAGATVQGSFTVTVMGGTARLISPVPGSPLLASTVRWEWTPGNGVSETSLEIGSVPGASDLFSHRGTAHGATATGLPYNSSRVYVRLGSLIAGGWIYEQYEFLSSGSFVPWLGPGSGEPQRVLDAPPGAQVPVPAHLVSPQPASVLEGSTQIFEWAAGAGVDRYRLWVGTAPGGDDLLNSEAGADLSVTVTNLPAGQTIYLRLWSQVNGVWLVRDYVFWIAGP